MKHKKAKPILKYKHKRTMSRPNLQSRFGMSVSELRKLLLKPEMQAKISSAFRRQKAFDVALPGERGGYRNFIAFRMKPYSYFDKRSFRLSPKKLNVHETRFLIGCPKGKWKKGKCTTSTTTHKVLIPISRIINLLRRPIMKIAANPIINVKRNPLLKKIDPIQQYRFEASLDHLNTEAMKTRYKIYKKYKSMPTSKLIQKRNDWIKWAKGKGYVYPRDISVIEDILMRERKQNIRLNPLLMTVSNKARHPLFNVAMAHRMGLASQYGCSHRNFKRNPLLMTVMNPCVRRNPVTQCPFPVGTPIPRGQFEAWLNSSASPQEKSKYYSEMKNYQRFHHGSLPVSVTRQILSVGMSKTITDRDFSFSTGKSPGELYSVPAHSNKKKFGKHYIHEYDKTNQPEGIVMGPSGQQVVVKQLVGNAKVTDWYHH